MSTSDPASYFTEKIKVIKQEHSSSHHQFCLPTCTWSCFPSSLIDERLPAPPRGSPAGLYPPLSPSLGFAPAVIPFSWATGFSLLKPSHQHAELSLTSTHSILRYCPISHHSWMLLLGSLDSVRICCLLNQVVPFLHLTYFQQHSSGLNQDITLSQRVILLFLLHWLFLSLLC